MKQRGQEQENGESLAEDTGNSHAGYIPPTNNNEEKIQQYAENNVLFHLFCFIPKSGKLRHR